MSSAEREPFLALDDYVSSAMPDEEAAGFEEDLFALAANGEAPELTTHDQLVQLARLVHSRTGFEVGSTAAQVAALRASELRVEYLDFDPEKPTQVPPLPAGTDLFTYRLPVDLRGYDQVDVVIETPEGQRIKTFRDVAYDPNDGALYGVCEAPLAELSFGRGPIAAKVMAKRAGGTAELVAVFEAAPAT